ncbi:MAG: hypothetical protein SGPRY_005352 [Prymnesium sp.]
MQANVILRNSGTMQAWAARLLRRSWGVELYRDDPLLLMAYIARTATQLDLAQEPAAFCSTYALIIVPSLVSFLVWRDGYYTLQDSGMLVEAFLQRRMALALLGLRTDFGKSEFAVESAGNLLKDDDKEARDAKVLARVGITVGQRELYREELSLSNLNYAKLYSKLIQRSWLFFTCVMLWQVLASCT